MSRSKIVLTVDENIKNEAEDIFSSLGLDLETAINIFLAKAVYEGGIPFEVKQTKYVDSPAFLSSHFIVKSAVYDIHEYIKNKFNEEPSFHLACDNRGLTTDEAGELFILFSCNTEDIKPEELTDKHIDNLIELSTTSIPSFSRLSDKDLRAIINIFITNYFLVR